MVFIKKTTYLLLYKNYYPSKININKLIIITELTYSQFPIF